MNALCNSGGYGVVVVGRMDDVALFVGDALVGLAACVSRLVLRRASANCGTAWRSLG